MCDCGFSNEKSRFRYRAGVIVIQDAKILFVKNIVGGYYYMVGGAVRLGETSAKCAERELLEETGISAKAEQLSIVCENFFMDNEFECHALEFYYKMNVTKIPQPQRTKTDIGEELIWIPLERIPEYDIRPSFLKQHTADMINTKHTLHIVHDDRNR